MSAQKTQHRLAPDLVSLYREDKSWQEGLLALQQKGNKKEIRTLLKEFYPADIAFLLEKLSFKQGQAIFEELNQETQGEVLSELHDASCRQYLTALSPKSLSAILRLQPSDRITHLLEKTDEERRQILLAFLPEEQRASIMELLAYPEDTAGAIMRKEYVTARVDDSVKKAISALRNSSHKGEHPYCLCM